MRGVKITENVNPEIKRKLGFEIVAVISFIWGVPYPLPDWYSSLSYLKKILWFLYCRFGDLLTTLLFISNIIELFLHYNDIRAFVTCTGTITYIICFRIKMHIYGRKAKVLEKVIDSLYMISENIHNNPVNNREFFDIHLQYFNHVLFFGKSKIIAIAGGVCTMATYATINGYFQDSPAKKDLLMYGWYPYNMFELQNFEITCIFQLFSYLSFLLKDAVVDLLFMTVLIVANSHLIYLGMLMGHFVERLEQPSRFTRVKHEAHLLKWWIRHHQMVLKTLEEFKEITSPYLFYNYISVVIILFFGGVLVTSILCMVDYFQDTEYDLIQQIIVLSINSSNLLQLYIFSVIGDKITENGLKLTENGLHINTIFNNKNTRTTYLYIATKCSKPVLIHFGQITPLCAASFLQIVKVTFSYFITIVQIRHKELEPTHANIIFLNSTHA